MKRNASILSMIYFFPTSLFHHYFVHCRAARARAPADKEAVAKARLMLEYSEAANQVVSEQLTFFNRLSTFLV